MNGQADRCDRTAYVSGLQPTISDIELFEVFNRVAHVEKVIVRSGVVRHALVVFKTVQGLYMVLVHFQGTFLHGRQLHIRPLRESSHANSETLTTMFEKAKHQGGGGNGQNRRPASVQERFHPSATPFVPSCEKSQNPRGQRMSSGSYGNRRRSGYNKNMFPNESYAGGPTMFDGVPCHQYTGLGTDNFQFEDYTEGAKRFDGLAHLIRSSTPTDPFSSYHQRGGVKNCDTNCSSQRGESRSRAGSARDQSAPKAAPPTWKMELQIKKNEEEERADEWRPDGAMSPEQFLAQIAHAEQQANGKKKRPNLSVINPSLFYEQYPRTSSPVTFAPQVPHHSDKIPSPHDPAVLAYSCMRAPQSAFAGLSPIDANNCSFVTKHLGTSSGEANNVSQTARRDLTHDELSDMIVSTGNLRINPSAIQSLYDQSGSDEPAPWSPVKRLRAESGSLSTAQFASPQFSPIVAKQPQIQQQQQSSAEFNETEDDVFSSENKNPDGSVFESKPCVVQPQTSACGNVLVEQKLQTFDDVNNSRLPSNSHSANPNSDKKEFLFPEFPLCRHSSVPSFSHLIGDISDFNPLSPHKMFLENSSSHAAALVADLDETVDKNLVGI